MFIGFRVVELSEGFHRAYQAFRGPLEVRSWLRSQVIVRCFQRVSGGSTTLSNHILGLRIVIL